MKLEKRYTAAAELSANEIRADQAAGQRQIKGYAAVFNSLSEDLGGFREKIQPGAFSGSVPDGDIRAFWNHNSDMVLGRTKNGSLTCREDDLGLGFDLNMPDTQAGRDAFTLIQDGTVSGVSFGFECQEDSWQIASDGVLIRTLLRVNLFEISPCAFPAYPATQVDARALDDIRGKLIIQPGTPALAIFKRKLQLLHL